jgi:hypothetical protein
VRAANLRMSSDPNVNEWTLVREQFDALLRERSDNIEDILDALFRNRFSEVITRAAERESRAGRVRKSI